MNAPLLASSIRRLISLSLFGLLAVSAAADPAGAADRVTAPPTPPVAPNTTLQLPNGAPLQPGDEVIQSWTVVPGGSGQRSFFSYNSAAGVTISDTVSVQNYGNVSLNLRVYATDGINAPDGTFALLAGDKQPTDVGSWITLAQENVTIPAGTQVLIPYTITIPAGANPGDHVGGIVASDELPTAPGKTNSVLVFRRTAVRLYLRVQGELRSNLLTDNFRISYDGGLNPSNGTASVRFRVANRGNVRQAGTYRLQVEGGFGLGKHDLGERPFPELLPGQSIEIAEDVSGVPALFVAKASVTVTPRADGDVAASQPTRRTARTFAPPILLMLIVALLLASLMAWRIWVHRREPDEPEVTQDPSGAGHGADSAEQDPVSL